MTKVEVQQLVVSTAYKYGVDPNLALGIASHESGFNPNAINVSNANGTKDWGVMQLNDTTIETMGVINPLDPVENVDAGVRLLASLLGRYSGDSRLALWAYASGPGNVGPNKTPNAIAQGFITYVQGYNGGSITAGPTGEELAGQDSGFDPSVFDGSEAPGSEQVSEASTFEWGTVAVLGVAGLGFWWAFSD